MPRIRSIQTYLIVIMSGMVAASGILLTAYSGLQLAPLVDMASSQQLEQQYQTAITAIEYETRTARVVGRMIAALPPVADAIERRDRDAAIRLLTPAHQVLREEGVTVTNLDLPPATVFLRLHDPKAFGDDISARRKTIVTAIETGKTVSGIEPGRDILTIWSSAPILRDSKVQALVDVGIMLNQSFLDRLKQRTGLDVALQVPNGEAFNTLGATFSERTLTHPGELQKVLAGGSITRNDTMGGRPVAIYVGVIRNFAGQPVAALELIKDMSDYAAIVTAARRDLTIGSLLVVSVGVVVAIFLARRLIRPLMRMIEAMGRLSRGDTEIAIPEVERRDEVGDIARAVGVFKHNMVETEKLRAEQELAKVEAARTQRATMLALSDRFERSIGGIVIAVADAANDMQATAGTMSKTAETASNQALSVSAASEQASRNVQTVATATEALLASISEIGGQADRSARIAIAASEQAQRTNATVSALADSAGRISEVVRLIETIAGQTNLLALNATIEAAHAGEHGKGFAVVASEVKSLANQTATATEDIRSQIQDIQRASGDSVDAIRAIASTVDELTAIAGTIASAVEEQSAAAREIASSVAQAAQGTNEVTGGIAGVSDASSDVGSAATEVLGAAGALSQQSRNLKSEVAHFLSGVRAA